jgi:hypothetical protein
MTIEKVIENIDGRLSQLLRYIAHSAQHLHDASATVLASVAENQQAADRTTIPDGHNNKLFAEIAEYNALILVRRQLTQ